jgi:hypothetical protein
VVNLSWARDAAMSSPPPAPVGLRGVAVVQREGCDP